MSPEDFFTLSERLTGGLSGGEVLFTSLDAESSDFVRINRGRVRQGGSVRSAALGLTLIDGGRQAEAACDLTGAADEDLARARALVERLRERLGHLPEDPYLSYSTEPWESDARVGAPPPGAGEALGELLTLGEGLDLVGIWASGEVAEGLASSLGHRHWHASQSFNLDWSAYLDSGRAVKSAYAGLSWDPAVLPQKLAATRADLEMLARPARTIAPGRYRAYLAPAAVAELLDMLAWGGFDLKGQRTRQTPLLKLIDGERTLDPRVTIREEHARGLRPGFTAEGFAKPASVTLIERGRIGQPLVDAREGMEYREPVNASGGGPESVALEAGELPTREALQRLDTGLWIGNLWYCNWSDPNECRITGMTRFATYWVEHGAIVAPLEVMRFDDSLYHLLGDRLEGLSAERELILSAQTYEGRSTESAHLPGLLISGIDLTL